MIKRTVLLLCLITLGAFHSVKADNDCILRAEVTEFGTIVNGTVHQLAQYAELNNDLKLCKVDVVTQDNQYVFTQDTYTDDFTARWFGNAVGEVFNHNADDPMVSVKFYYQSTGGDNPTPSPTLTPTPTITPTPIPTQIIGDPPVPPVEIYHRVYFPLITRGNN